jgi:hypothetical protein
MKCSIFSDITPCGLVKVNWHFGEHSTSIFMVYSKPHKEPAEPGGKPVKAFTADFPVNRMARQLNGNTGKYAEGGSITA